MLPRVFVSLEDSNNVKLSKEDSHHLAKVLRLDVGSEVHVADPVKQKTYQAVISERKEVITLKIIGEFNERQVSSPVASLAVAMTKGDHNDLVCEKATELGVENLIFWQAERSVVKFGNEDRRRERLSRIALAACRQSGKSKLPRIIFLRNLAAVLEHYKSNEPKTDLIACCSLSKKAQLPHELSNFTRAHLIVGPEGDYTDNEDQLIIKENCTLLSLGPYTLRTETAAITAVAALQAVLRFKQ